MDVLGTTRDLRTNTPVVYVKATVEEYIHLIGDDFESFTIQRRREKHKAYERMRKDIAAGALLPAIVLAVKADRVPSVVGQLSNTNALQRMLSEPGHASILDGLQRTYILRDLRAEGVQFKPDQSLLLEFWLEADVSHLVYRMIVLNAGQKPMSMRHQIELLFSTIKGKLEEEIPSLEIYTERDQTRRRRPRKYALDRLALAYQCFLTQTPETQRENIIAQRLLEADILDSSEETLFREFELFVSYLRRFARLDDEVCRVYDAEGPEGSTPTGASWFGSENLINSFFGAIAQFASSDDRAQRVGVALDALASCLASASPGADPLGLQVLGSVTEGFNPRKVNIGFATRKLLTSAFKEYFLDGGATPLSECWKRAAE